MGEARGLMPVTRRKFLRGIAATGAIVLTTGRGNHSYAQNLPRPGSADWSRFGYDLHNTRFNAHEMRLGRENVSRLKVKWAFRVYWKTMLTNPAPSGPNLNSTAVGYNRIFVVSNSRNPKGNMSVSAGLNAYNGDIEWWTLNSALIGGPVALANGVFYQGLDDGSLEALDVEDGRILWQHQLPTPYRGGTAIANGTLYTSNGAPMTGWTPEEVQSHDYFLYAFTLDGE